MVTILSQGCAPRLRSPPRPRLQGIYHVVRAGENLFRIGKAYDVPHAELARLNGIVDPDQIRVGQRLFIPGATRRLPVEIITPAKATLERLSRAPKAAKTTFVWPVAGEITSKFGPRGEVFHDGIDIAAPDGAPIRAIEQGEVIYSDQLRGYGNILIIRHPDGFASVYAHNKVNLVRDGQKVEQGEIVGEVGQSGRVSGPHLHFEIRKDNVAEDPLYYLP
jgi:murein DD-endopeptidase MepM/ murein hydrolase activator NlpD